MIAVQKCIIVAVYCEWLHSTEASAPLVLHSTIMFSSSKFKCRAQHTSEIASIACLHNFFRHALLPCCEILTYKLLGSQLLILLSMDNSSLDQWHSQDLQLGGTQKWARRNCSAANFCKPRLFPVKSSVFFAFESRC